MRKFKLRKSGVIGVVTLTIGLSLSERTMAGPIERINKHEHVRPEETVTGTVRDANGPVVGASVMVKGSTKGTVTDENGNFTLQDVEKGAVIEISYLGYVTQEVTYNGQKSLSVTLAADSQMLSEAVVTGMGITREARQVGFAQTTISAKELTKTGAPNFAAALYGKAPGVRIQQVQGGGIAGVSVTVRGLSSITGNNQPLLVINGVPIRNGGTGSGPEGAFAEFGSEGRIRGNGLIDINPEDIESLTILKGAAATGLYGSEAANGVVMITTKRSREKEGMAVDFNASVMTNRVAFIPKIQTEYGPSRYTFQYNDYEKETGGFFERTLNGQSYRSLSFGNHQWGPRYDGSDVLYWDGSIRKYQAITDEPWKELFRNGSSQIYNLAINHGGEKSSTRFSYTFNKEIPNALTGDYKKHYFALTSNLKISKKVSVDYSINYVMQDITNRAGNAMGVYGSFSNGFGSFLDVPLLKRMYKTSLGYRNTHLGGENTLTPDEVFAFQENNTNGVRNILWDTYEKNLTETSNRLIASIAPSWKINDWLTFRPRLSTDITVDKQEARENTERPLAFFDPSGKYAVLSRRYNIYYGDVLLMANKKLTEKLNLTANVGWQGRIENAFNINSWTDGGLASENWFSLNASRFQARTNIMTQDLLKTAYVGTVGLSWNDFLYFDVTGRQEKSSTLKKGNNSYFYPSFSGSFIFSDAFNSFPAWWNYGKLRASYGIVGNAPGVYAANVVYEQGSNNGFVYNHVPNSLGNENIRPEVTKEYEIGIENKFFNNRLGFELNFYNRDITDMILSTPQPSSTGATSILLNVGSMKNYGYEVNLYGTPVETRNFSWSINGNIARNFNEVVSLIEGVSFIQNAGWAGDGIVLRSYVGRPMGDFYVYRPERDANGNKMVSDEGYYINNSEREAVGNALPKFVGGVVNKFTYKNFSFDALVDFTIGGQVFNEMYQYSTALGITPATLKYRSAETGGLAYYYPGDDNSGSLPVAAAPNATSGPNGERVYHNGVIQEGVVKSTGKPNEQIQPVDYLTYYTYNWGTDPEQLTMEHAVFDKSYVKMREMSLTYALPRAIASRLHFKNLSLSVFGRNLFYIYKAMPDWDAESSIGTNWVNQAQIGGSTAPTRTIGFSLRAQF